jgi:hypothetical protein
MHWILFKFILFIAEWCFMGVWVIACLSIYFIQKFFLFPLWGTRNKCDFNSHASFCGENFSYRWENTQGCDYQILCYMLFMPNYLPECFYQFKFLQRIYEHSYFSHHKYHLLSSFKILAILIMYELITHYGANMYFLMTNNASCLSMCLLAIHVFFLANVGSWLLSIL